MMQGRVRAALVLSAAGLLAMVVAGCSTSLLNEGADAPRGGLAVNSPVAATVWVDGQMVGDANVVIPGLVPGIHLVEARDGGGRTLLSVSYELEPYDVGELWTDAEEFGSSVYAPAAAYAVVAEPATRGIAPSADRADAVVATALGLTGTARYAHRYSPPRWFDCSGFTYYAFKQNGVNLGTKDDDKQAKLGTYVSRAKLAKGDLVFFSSTKSGPGRIGHVGIYEGSDRFVHIFKPGETVAVSRLGGSPWWSSHYVTARRVMR